MFIEKREMGDIFSSVSVWNEVSREVVGCVNCLLLEIDE